MLYVVVVVGVCVCVICVCGGWVSMCCGLYVMCRVHVYVCVLYGVCCGGLCADVVCVLV